MKKTLCIFINDLVVISAVSGAMAERSDELAAAGAGLAVAGVEELEIAAGAAEVAGELVDEAMDEAVVGGAELGVAATMDEVAQELDED